jgi:AhpD family alkylhydroperoxidase
VPRIPYVAADIGEPAALIETIRGRRGGSLFNLDRILLHSPAFAQAWNAFMGQVRGGLSVSPKLRELAICVVAVVNRADYEYQHHVPELRAAGATVAQLAALELLADDAADVSMFDATERAVIAFTRALTRDAAVDDATFDALAAALPGHRQLVELTGVIGAYNMVSRFLVSFAIESE